MQQLEHSFLQLAIVLNVSVPRMEISKLPDLCDILFLLLKSCSFVRSSRYGGQVELLSGNYLEYSVKEITYL